MRKLFANTTWLCALMLLTFNVYAANPANAEAVIKNTTDKVLKKLKHGSNEGVHVLIDQVVLPHFDFIKMSRLVLKEHWKTANKSQKRSFVKAFRGLLVRTYATALVSAAGKVRKIDYSTTATSSKKAIVSAKIYQTGKSQPLKVDYAMYYKGKWKVYNVTVGGVSLVTTYRTEFAGVIKKKGIDGLVDYIKNKKAKKVN